MAYGSIKVDNIIFTNGGADETTTVSGIYKAITSGVTVSGTISGTTIQGQTISGVTVTGTTIQGASGTFTSLTGVTTTGTTANFVTHNGASGVFTTLLSGATVTGTTAQFTNITGGGIGATTITGTTVTGTTANFVSGVFTTQISGATVTGTTANFTSGNFTALSGASTTVTSGIFAVGSAAAPSISFTSDPNTGIYSPGADQVAISTNGTGRLFVDASGNLTLPAGGNLGINGAAPQSPLDVISNASGYGISLRGRSGDSLAQFRFTSNDHTTIYALLETAPTYLAAHVNGSERLRLTSAGLLGLGTSSPTAKLESYFSSTNPSLSSNTGAGLSVNGTSTVRLNFGNYPGSPFSSWVQSSDGVGTAYPIALNPLGGSVGIGTTSPAALLDVSAGIRVNSAGSVTSGFSNGVNVGGYDAIGYDANDLVLGGYRATQFTGLRFYTGGTERLRINSSGNVGIGTSAPSSNGNLTVLMPGANGTGIVVRAQATGGSGSQSALVFEKPDGTINSRIVSDIGTGYLALQQNGTDRLVIDNSGRCGIGTTSPGATFDANGTAFARGGQKIQGYFSPSAGDGNVINIGTTGGINYIQSLNGTSQSQLSFDGSPIVFRGADFVEIARFDTSGRLLVGTSSSSAGQVVVATTNGSAAIAVSQDYASGYDESISIIRASGSGASVTNGTPLGNVTWKGIYGGTAYKAASIEAYVDGTPGANDMPGRLVFSTTADGAASPTERMTIDNAGNLLIGKTTTAIGTAGARFTNDGILQLTRDSDTQLATNRLTNDGVAVAFSRSGTQVGNISVTTTATAYNTSSDYRLKENVVPLTGAIDRVNDLQVHRFNFIADPDKTVDGFIAHEAQAVIPEAITGEKDAVDDEGNPVYQGIDQSKLVPLLTAALQEAITKIETLEARLTAAGIE